LVAEADYTVVAVKEPFIGNRDPIRVAPKVVQDLLRTGQRGLGVDDPRLGTELGQQALPFHETAQSRAGTLEDQLALAVRRVESGQELAAKDFSQGADGEEKAPFLAGDPPRAVRTQAAPSDDTVEMDVGHESLSPGVQDRGAAEFRTQMLGIAGERGERGSHG